MCYVDKWQVICDLIYYWSLIVSWVHSGCTDGITIFGLTYKPASWTVCQWGQEMCLFRHLVPQGLVWYQVPKRSSTVLLVSQYTSYGIFKIMLNTWNQALFLLLYYDILMPKFILLFCFWGRSCLTGDWIFYFTWSQLNALGSYKWLCHIKLHQLECTHMEMISMFC